MPHRCTGHTYVGRNYHMYAKGLCADMCADMCVDKFIDMCVDMCV